MTAGRPAINKIVTHHPPYLPHLTRFFPKMKCKLKGHHCDMLALFNALSKLSVQFSSSV